MKKYLKLFAVLGLTLAVASCGEKPENTETSTLAEETNEDSEVVEEYTGEYVEIYAPYKIWELSKYIYAEPCLNDDGTLNSDYFAETYTGRITANLTDDYNLILSFESDAYEDFRTGLIDSFAANLVEINENGLDAPAIQKIEYTEDYTEIDMYIDPEQFTALNTAFSYTDDLIIKCYYNQMINKDNPDNYEPNVTFRYYNANTNELLLEKDTNNFFTTTTLSPKAVEALKEADILTTMLEQLVPYKTEDAEDGAMVLYYSDSAKLYYGKLLEGIIEAIVKDLAEIATIEPSEDYTNYNVYITETEYETNAKDMSIVLGVYTTFMYAFLDQDVFETDFAINFYNSDTNELISTKGLNDIFTE